MRIVMQCPWNDCGYLRVPSDDAPKWQCPECKNVYLKHPDYQYNLFIEISSENIRNLHFNNFEPDILYLFLKKDQFEGMFLNKQKSVQKILFNRQNLPFYYQIITDLNSNKKLTPQQERTLFLATSKILKDYKPDKESFNFRPYRMPILLLLLFSILIFCYHLNSEKSSFYTTTSYNKLKPNYKPISTDNKYQDNELEQYGLNLEELESKLNILSYNIRICKDLCSVPHCEKFAQLSAEAQSSIQSYWSFLRNYSIDKFSNKNKQLIRKIHDQLGDIIINVGNATENCKK